MKKILVLLLVLFTLNCTENARSQKIDKKLVVTDATISKLILLKNKRKFLRDDKMLYPGAMSKVTRLSLNHKINQLISRILKSIKHKPYKSYVLGEFKLTLSQCNNYDTEDRERICHYMEAIMDIFAIQSSDGLLNTWMYGF